MERNFPVCQICGQDIVSDAATPSYCRLCGMGIEEQQDFCCNSCEDKFEKFVKR